jgi:hypothetical protein
MSDPIRSAGIDPPLPTSMSGVANEPASVFAWLAGPRCRRLPIGSVVFRQGSVDDDYKRSARTVVGRGKVATSNERNACGAEVVACNRPGCRHSRRTDRRSSKRIARLPGNPAIRPAFCCQSVRCVKRWQPGSYRGLPEPAKAPTLDARLTPVQKVTHSEPRRRLRQPSSAVF